MIYDYFSNNLYFRFISGLLLLIFLNFFVIKLIISASDTNYVVVVRYLLFIVAILLFSYLLNKNYEDKIYNALIITPIINCVVLVSETLIWIYKYGLVIKSEAGFFRPDGIFASPVESSTYLVIGMALLYVSNWPRLVKIIFLVIFLFFILLSFSRSAYVGLMIVFIYAFSLYMVSRKRMLDVGLFVTGLIILFSSLSLNPVMTRIIDITNINFNIKRLMVWQYTLDKWISMDRELILGFPIGSFRFFHPIDLEYYNNIHNSYLDIAYYFGVLGVMLLICFFGLAIYKMFLQFKLNSPNKHQFLLLFLVLFTINLVDTIYLSISLYLVHALIISKVLEAHKAR